ncbi:MAG: DoxX family protein [Parafilimonas sp.]
MQQTNFKKASLYIMGVLYVFAGINHFVHPHLYEEIIPSWLPCHPALIFISGACEIILGTLLIPFITRRFAAWGIVALLIVVFPANVQMMLNYLHSHNTYLWLAIIRLPLQAMLIWWAWLFTKKEVIPV